MAGITPEQIAKARDAGYSDDQIAAHLAKQMPAQFKQAKEAGYTATQILDHLGGTKSSDVSADDTTTEDAPVTASGVAKAALTGLGPTAASSIIGLPGDAATGADWLARKFGASDQTLQRLQTLRDYLPTSESMQNRFENMGIVHRAQNPTERSVENVASFLPLAAAGPEALAANVIKRGVVPGVASELAGKAAEGTDYEIPARIAGALVQKGKAAPQAPASAALRAEGGAGSQAVRDLQFANDGAHADQFLGNTLDNFNKRNLDLTPSGAPGQTTQVLQDFQGRPLLSAKDYDAMKLRLNAVEDNPAARASAIKALNEHIAGLTPATTIGDVDAMKSLWSNAAGNYAAGMRGTTIDNAISNALDNAAAKNSGMNVGTDIRSTLKPLTKNQNELAIKSGFNPAEIAKIRQITNGTIGSNTLRMASNMLGGGGGIGALVTAGLFSGGGAAAEGPSGGLAGPAAVLAGLGLRKGYNAMQMNRAQALSNLVRSRAPLAQASVTSSKSIPPGVQRILNMSHALTRAHDND
jgi:hypothetical protein